MKSRYYFTALLCALLAMIGCGKKDDDSSGGGGGGGSTEYTLNVRTPGEGSTLRGTFKVDISMTIDVKDKSGKPIPEAKGRDVKEEAAYHETIDVFPDGAKRPTKSRVTIDKWEKAKGADGFTKDGTMSKIVGREIIVENRGGFYDIHPADGGPLDGNVRLFIDNRYQDIYENFNIQDFLPGKPVRLYSSWDIPVRRIVKAMGNAAAIPFDEAKSKGSGKLTRVWDKEGRKYGRIELTADLSAKFPAKDVTVKESKIEAKWVIDLCIDGSKHDISATATVEVVFEFASEKEGNGKIQAKGTVTIMEVEEKIGKAANPPATKTETKKPGKGGNIPVEGDTTPDVATKEEFPDSGFAPQPPSKGPGSAPKLPVAPERFPKGEPKAPEPFPKGDPSPKGFK